MDYVVVASKLPSLSENRNQITTDRVPKMDFANLAQFSHLL